MLTTILPPDIATAMAEVDQQIVPWLIPGKDEWRKDQDGLPVLDDLRIALCRVRGQRERPELRLDVWWDGYAEVTVSERGCRDEYTAGTLPEALLLMLADDLQRTCVVCREYDGHDIRCSVLAREEMR